MWVFESDNLSNPMSRVRMVVRGSNRAMTNIQNGDHVVQPGTVFVNVSRGAIVDTAALVERLKEGDIVAGCDAFDPEPVPPDHEILQLDNAFVSPHFGWVVGDEPRPREAGHRRRAGLRGVRAESLQATAP